MFTTRPELRGTFGMIASTHWLASAAGMAALEKGGNAFDAACTAGFVLQVVEPHQNGPLGDMPAILYSAAEDKVRVICAQGPAPAAATIAHYRAEGLDYVPGTGLLAAVVPGAFDGWLTMLRDHGTMTPREVMEPAIGYARDGYPVVPMLNTIIGEVRELFLQAWPTSAALYLPGGKPPEIGALFANPTLAETFARIVKESEAAPGGREAKIATARRAFYEGFVAEAVESFATKQEVLDSSGNRHKGLLTAQDMAGWHATVEEPTSYNYHAYTMFKTGPWGQGPALLQMLALLKGFDIAAMDPAGADFVHTVVECSKLAYADREIYYGDPDFTDVPLAALLSDEYNDARRKLIGADASLELRPGALAGIERALPQAAGKIAAETGRPGIAGAEGVLAGPTSAASSSASGKNKDNLAARGEMASDTVHVNVTDRWGNMVSCMPSGGWLQSSPVIPALGFCLGSRAQMFWLEDGLPASLAPGKRPRTTLTPGLAFRDGKPYMAFGSPGGDAQDQWALAFFLRHAQGGMNMQAAIDAPMHMSQHWPNSFYPREAKPGHLQVEDRYGEAVIGELARRGHRIERMGDWALGRLAAVARENGLLKAAANARFMQGYAAGR